MLSRGDHLCVGESKTLQQKRCADCGRMHVDGERSSPKHGSHLAGKCPPPSQAAGHLTLRERLTSNGTSAIPELGSSPARWTIHLNNLPLLRPYPTFGRHYIDYALP